MSASQSIETSLRSGLYYPEIPPPWCLTMRFIRVSIRVTIRVRAKIRARVRISVRIRVPARIRVGLG